MKSEEPKAKSDSIANSNSQIEAISMFQTVGGVVDLLENGNLPDLWYRKLDPVRFRDLLNDFRRTSRVGKHFMVMEINCFTVGLVSNYPNAYIYEHVREKLPY